MAKRSYFDELQELKPTWDKVWSAPPAIPHKIDSNWVKGNAFCIGSGGSLCLAKMWQQIHESHNLGIGKTLTPYEFYHTPIIPDIVVLFSASGKNHDILQVFKIAITHGCKVLIFTSSQHSELVRLSKTHFKQSHVIYPNFKSSKDGFLAVNSIVLISCLMAHFERILFGKDYNQSVSPVDLAIKHHCAELSKISNIFGSTIQIIASEWGSPAGYDLESRLAESGLCPCFLTDPRNFGHGRFLWLEKWKSSSFLVIFHTPESKSFIARFNRTLPPDVPNYVISSFHNGLLGAIYCVTRSILLCGAIAEKQKIDPGKPEVPRWGRKLHRLYFKSKMIDTDNILKKKPICFPALTVPFSAIAMDYDGTLVDTKDRFDPINKELIKEIKRLLKLGLKIGIATGRGKSALVSLKKQIPKEYHRQIIVGQYNGSIISRLSDNHDDFIQQWHMQAIIKSIISEINPKNLKISLNPTHISIREGSVKDREYLLHDIMAKAGQFSRFIRFRASGHSIDIFPIWSTKLLVVEALAESRESQILCIGDQGQIGGNDEDLLSWLPSVCVGEKRPISNNCLWIGKHKHLQESSGTLFVLNNIKKEGSFFQFDSIEIYD